MKENFQVEEIAGKVFSGNATQKELFDLRQWLSESENNRKLYDSYLNCWVVSKAAGRTDACQTNKAWYSLDKQITSGGKTFKLSIQYFLKIAAILIFAAGVAITARLLMEDKVSDQLLSHITHTTNDAILKISLPDSSTVWLSNRSTLRYPSDFNQNNRNVYLEGEGYFDIVENEGLPFIVHTTALQIKVLGTSFNVNAYTDAPDIVTTLVSGKIDVRTGDHSSTFLQPNQQLIFHKDGKNIELLTVNTEPYVSWVNGYYKFEETSFEQIARKFERIYDVEIIFEDDSLKKMPFTGTLLHEQSIEVSLNLLKEIKHFKYVAKKNQITISK